MKYYVCNGMEERDLVGAPTFPFQQEILIENYRGQMVFRSKNCDYVMKNICSNCCEHCFSLKILLQKHLELDGHQTEDENEGVGRPQKVLVARNQGSLFLDSTLSYSIP